jgi:protein-L-isoaspartate(D-aspartate) O-methyltransferase
MAFDEASDPYAADRERMTAEQIEGRGISDPRVLDAMRRVPRHLFVPPSQWAHAYEDRPLPIGERQTISQPYMVAAMTAALAPRSGDRVLEVGTGSGYQAAILARLAREVISIERHPPLAEGARRALEAAGLPGVIVVVGDGTQGYPERQPYDRIIVTAGAPSVPPALLRQLADGGRLVIPVGPAAHQELIAIDRHGSEYQRTVLEGCVFVPLVGEHGWSQ